MTIAYITAGAAGTLCGNCLGDNALALALKRQGHDVLLLPAYTPLLTDDTDVSDERVVFSGINLYLQAKYSFFRSSGVLDRVLDNPRLLRWVSKFGVDTEPAKLGEMTQDMLRGAEGPYHREMQKLVAVLQAVRPAIVHLTNSMLASTAEPIKQHLGVPVVCSLQGEADFLAGLPEPYREACYGLLRRHAAHIDAFVAPCADQADSMAAQLGIEAAQIETVLPGISLEGFERRRKLRDDRFVVGFLARISEEKGLHLLADAVSHLRRQHPDRTVELRVAGWRRDSATEYLSRTGERFQFEDFGYLSRNAKLDFLHGLDAFSVPTTYRASKGLYVLEAMAAGVPVVQPGIGVFPELLKATGGGLTCEAGDSQDLAAKLGTLMTDSVHANRLGIGGQQAVRERFHIGRMASQTAALYQRLSL